MHPDGESGFPAAENAFEVWSHVPSTMVAEGADRRPPDVTIAVPTWRRAHLLVETLRSIAAQDFDGVVEILVADDGSESRDAETILAQLPELNGRCFRYYVNATNIGLFPNWNRCIELARGPWMSILNDDDLLDPDFLTAMFADLRRHPDAQGIVCRKRFFGSHVDRLVEEAPTPPAERRLGGMRGLLRPAARFAWSALNRIQARRVWNGKRSRRVSASEFFWGAVLHNGAGFLFRREAALRFGGYQLNEGPSADYWFYARFALNGHLRQHEQVAASVRKDATNVTGRTIIDALLNGYRLQRALAGTVVPRWWRRFLPLMISHDRADMMREWNADVPQEEVERTLGIRLVRDRPLRVDLLRRLFWRHGRSGTPR